MYWESAKRSTCLGEVARRRSRRSVCRKRGEVWAVVGKFGFTPGLCAVRPCLLGVRRADRDVEGGVRVAKGRGEDVSGSEVSARNETWNLSLGSAVTGLSRNVHKCSDRVVTAGGLAHGATGGVGGACVQGSRLAGSTKHRFTGSGAAQEQSYRVNVLHRLQHSSMMRVEAPQPGVIDLCVAKFQQLRVSPPGALVLVHLKQPLMDARIHASGDESLDGGCSSSPSPSPGVLPRAWESERMESADPAWHPRSQRVRCARGVPARPELHQADPAGAALRSSGGCRIRP